jgi:hypothetical protein
VLRSERIEREPPDDGGERTVDDPFVGNGTSGRLFVFWKATIRHAALRFCST